MEIQELGPCFYQPDIYRTELDTLSIDKILRTYCDEILQNCTSSDAESVLVDYVTSFIEPVGWKAIWKTTKEFSVSNFEYDFVVEVVNVSLQKLEADVYVKSVIVEDHCSFSDLEEKVKPHTLISVPLIELYPISEGDDEELFVDTASTIEYVRFFLTQLSRPWDNVDDDVVYCEKILKPRLQLYFDMKNNVLPKRLIAKIKSTLREGWKILRELNTLHSDMNVSDPDAEINEDDLMQSMSLRVKLGELEAKMEILENPLIRSFMMKKFVPSKSTRKIKKTKPIMYIIAKEFTFEMICSLNLEDDTVLEFENNPESAIKCSSSGDKILIFPGTYECDTLGWIESEINIEGLGSCEEIILEATGNSEVFLNCCSPCIRIKSVCLKAKESLLSTIVVHHGTVYIDNCIIDNKKADIGILLLGGSSAIVEDTTILNCGEDGIQMRCLSTLDLTSSKIYDSERHGIQIDAENSISDNSFTTLTVINSQIFDNGGYGIFLNNAPIKDISLQKPIGDFSALTFFPWLKHKLENSGIDKNSLGDIGISSLCASNLEEAESVEKVLLNCPNSEDLNYSVLSDLLNDISFTDFNVSKYDN